MALSTLPWAPRDAEPVLAGFSTRAGGDDPEALAGEAGFDPGRLFMVSQVHGKAVVRVGLGDDPSRIRQIQADALVTDLPGLALAVRTADCVPVLLWDPRGRAVGAAHAGWRGLVAGVVDAAVEAVSELAGCAASELSAAIGPAIDACCFEVGEEVAEEVALAAADPAVVVRRDGAPRPFVDLRRAAALRLSAAGLGAARVETVGPCTRCSEGLLHSYRREGPRSGRQVAFVALRDRPRGDR